jgi:restriction system protein
MSIPDFQSTMRPLLAYASDGKEKSIKQAIKDLADQMSLSEEERSVLLPSGVEPIFTNRVRWARTYLSKADALKRTRRGHFEITDRGKKLLAENPVSITNKVLQQFPEFQKFQAPTTTAESPGDHAAEVAPEIDVVPEEAIEQAETQLLKNLRSQLLDRIRELSPAFFERLVVDLVVAMGYGGSKDSVVQKLGKSGDEGIDGVVNQDPLGLDVVYVQAKRYSPDNTIGRQHIQQFAGALIGQGANKGVFVTTSTFTKQATEYANKVPQRIILIDGERFTDLMVRHNVGVQIQRTLEIKRIDLGYFDEVDE